jgi:hypothetical protein
MSERYYVQAAKWLGMKLAQLAAAIICLYLTYGALLLISCTGGCSDNAPRVIHWLAWVWMIVLGIALISFVEQIVRRVNP